MVGELHLSLRSFEAELLSKILVWIFSPDGDSTGLVNSKLNKDTVGDAVAIIVLDLTRPWTFLETLQKYTAVLEKRAKELDVAGRPEASEDSSGAERYLGFPLIVVGTKVWWTVVRAQRSQTHAGRFVKADSALGIL